MSAIRIATAWLDGCSGCHMSLLDMDEKLIELASKVEMVFGPLVDWKEFPEDVEITLVEGAVSTVDDRNFIHVIRERTRILVSLGDCAITANIPAMRNRFSVDEVLTRAYIENASHNADIPTIAVPHLLKRSRPIHEFVKVDVFLPGCPPPSHSIYFVIDSLIEGCAPDLTGMTRFGA